MMGRWVRCLALIGLALVSCGPVRETVYRLEPPPDPSAATQACLAGCATERDACLIPAEERFRTCENRSTLRLQACESQAQLDRMVCSATDDRYDVGCFRRSCERALCSTAEIDGCEADHRRCFAACGGRVVEEER